MAERTITISEENARAVDQLLEEGRAASSDEIVKAGIVSFGRRARDDVKSADDAELSRWLRDVVAPRIERRRADPGPDLTMEEVRKHFAGASLASRSTNET